MLGLGSENGRAPWMRRGPRSLGNSEGQGIEQTLLTFKVDRSEAEVTGSHHKPASAQVFPSVVQ